MKVLTAIYSVHPPNFSFNSSRHPQDLLRKSGCTQKWVNREISNFDYLMQVSVVYNVKIIFFFYNWIPWLPFDSHRNYFLRPVEHHSRAHLQRPVAISSVPVGVGRLYVRKIRFERSKNVQRLGSAGGRGEPQQWGWRSSQVQELRGPERNHRKIPLRHTLFEFCRRTALFGQGRTVYIPTHRTPEWKVGIVCSFLLLTTNLNTFWRSYC